MHMTGQDDPEPGWRFFRAWLNGGVLHPDSAESAARAEQVFGFRVAGVGRFLVCAVLAAYTPFGMPVQTLGYVLLAVAAFAAISVVQMTIANRDWFLGWGKYVFVAADLTAVILVVIYRNPFGENLWTLIQSFRLGYFTIFFVYLGAIALTGVPALLLMVGGMISATWIAVTLILTNQPGVVTWLDLENPATAASEESLGLFLNPQFFDISARLLEAISVLVLSVLLAIAAWHGRANFRRFSEAEAGRRRTRETFSRYVPEHVARAMLSQDGMLAPERRDATILFADIEGFTTASENADPAAVLDLLNSYYDAVGDAVASHGGIVTQFQGDGLLAMFAPPLAAPSPAGAAVRTAADIHALLADRRFGGMQLKVRIGIATGPVVAGTLGGRARLSYTVIGDTVNLAARLQEMNKTSNTRTLICERTARETGAAARPIGRMPIRGRQGEVEVFSLD